MKRKTYSCTIVNNFDPVQVHVFGMSPHHGQNQIVHQRDGFVYLLKKHVQEILQNIYHNNILVKIRSGKQSKCHHLKIENRTRPVLQRALAQWPWEFVKGNRMWNYWAQTRTFQHWSTGKAAALIQSAMRPCPGTAGSIRSCTAECDSMSSRRSNP